MSSEPASHTSSLKRKADCDGESLQHEDNAAPVSAEASNVAAIIESSIAAPIDESENMMCVCFEVFLLVAFFNLLFVGFHKHRKL